MFKLKNYRLGFDWHGLIMIVTFLLPYVIWAFIPSKDDIFRKDSVTIITDIIKVAANVCIIFLTTFIINDTRKNKVMRIFLYILMIPKLFYYIGWILLYFGYNYKFIILDVCIAPCIVLLMFSLSRRNLMAFSAIVVYTICEVIYTLYNFIL